MKLVTVPPVPLGLVRLPLLDPPFPPQETSNSEAVINEAVINAAVTTRNLP
jgi:hypothetical protein